MTHDCPDCGRSFGGTAAYDRHLDRRRDRCKSNAQLHRIGIVPNASGVYVRGPINTQATLIDLRSVARTPKTTRRGKTLALAEAAGVRSTGDAESRAPGRCGSHCRDATTLACVCSCGGRYHGAGRRAGELEARDRGQISLGAAS